MSAKEAFDRLRLFLGDRAHAYRMVFNRENVFTDVVLKDLAKFCRANEPTFHEDPRVHAALEGRREVWLRIANHLHMSPDDLVKKFGGKEQ